MTGAKAIGVPGWPELACCTASIERVRMVLMLSWSRTRLCPALSCSGSRATSVLVVAPVAIERLLAIVPDGSNPSHMRRSAPLPLTRMPRRRFQFGGRTTAGTFGPALHPRTDNHHRPGDSGDHFAKQTP